MIRSTYQLRGDIRKGEGDGRRARIAVFRSRRTMRKMKLPSARTVAPPCRCRITRNPSTGHRIVDSNEQEGVGRRPNLATDASTRANRTPRGGSKANSTAGRPSGVATMRPAGCANCLVRRPGVSENPRLRQLCNQKRSLSGVATSAAPARCIAERVARPSSSLPAPASRVGSKLSRTTWKSRGPARATSCASRSAP